MDGKNWLVPCLVGSWSPDLELQAALALNGGPNGGLTGDLDAGLVAQIVAEAAELDRLALGISENEAEQIVADYQAPLMEPAINLDGLERVPTPGEGFELVRLRLDLPAELAAEAKAQLRTGRTPADLIQHGTEGGASGKKAKAERKGSPPAASKAKRATVGGKGKASRGNRKGRQ